MRKLFLFAVVLIIPIATGLRCYACESTNSHCEGTTHYRSCGYGFDACFVARNKSDYTHEHRQCGFKELCDVGFRNHNPSMKKYLDADYEIVSVCTTDLCNGAIVDNCDSNDQNDGDNGLQCYKCDSRDGQGKCNDGNEFNACAEKYHACFVARSMNNSDNIIRGCAVHPSCGDMFRHGDDLKTLLSDVFRTEAICQTDQCNGRGVVKNCLLPGSNDASILKTTTRKPKTTTRKYEDTDGLQCYQCKSTNDDCEGSIHYGTCKRGYDACFVARSGSASSKEIRSCGYKDMCNSTNYNSHIRKLLEYGEYQVIAVCDSDLCNGAIRDTCAPHGIRGKKSTIVLSSTAISIIIVVVIVLFLLIVLVSAVSKYRSRITLIRLFV